MKILKISKYAFVLLIGILIHFFFIRATGNPPKSEGEIKTEIAAQYFQNFRQQMRYDVSKDERSGYFDVSQQTLTEMLKNMKENSYDEARIYFGQDAYPNPTTNILLMNGMTYKDGKYNEVNIGKIMTVNSSIGVNECPHYCDIKSTIVGNVR